MTGMRNLIVPIAWLLLTGSQDPLTAVDAFIRAEIVRQQVPGVAVAIVRNGQPVRMQGYGLANVEHDVPVTPDTIFQSGSVGKQF